MIEQIGKELQLSLPQFTMFILIQDHLNLISLYLIFFLFLFSSLII